MIQDQLLGASSSSLLVDPKISFNNGPPNNNNNVSSGTAIPSSSTSDNNNSNNNNNNNNNNSLRCPRCDSANTKFCYYNNYNLTQPRHFCKTCRRYWTKGGALRNVPIGGGCRKNKATILTGTASKSSSGSKFLKTHDLDTARTHLGFDHVDLPNNYSNPNTLWGSGAPQTSSHILALLGATSPNPNPNPNLVKDEAGPHMMVHQAAPLVLNGRAMGLDHFGHQAPCFGLSSSSMHQNGSIVVGSDVHNSGLQELYQRLIRSSSSSSSPTTNNYFSDHHSSSQPVALMSSAGATESGPMASELGYYGWNVNPAFSWSDLPTTNGAYH